MRLRTQAEEQLQTHSPPLKPTKLTQNTKPTQNRSITNGCVASGECYSKTRLGPLWVPPQFYSTQREGPIGVLFVSVPPCVMQLDLPPYATCYLRREVRFAPVALCDCRQCAMGILLASSLKLLCVGQGRPLLRHEAQSSPRTKVCLPVARAFLRQLKDTSF